MTSQITNSKTIAGRNKEIADKMSASLDAIKSELLDNYYVKKAFVVTSNSEIDSSIETLRKHFMQNL